ncbi:uncharacterized protein LOC141911903 [Tubulanus polymorphus]|uniref:uncharacterized protein LOC141911903 n=1 Tax=Tubulanus polymorphus TaxID=672921 RepID=UPI003DA4BD5B
MESSLDKLRKDLSALSLEDENILRQLIHIYDNIQMLNGKRTSRRQSDASEMIIYRRGLNPDAISVGRSVSMKPMRRSEPAVRDRERRSRMSSQSSADELDDVPESAQNAPVSIEFDDDDLFSSPLGDLQLDLQTELGDILQPLHGILSQRLSSIGSRDTPSPQNGAELLRDTPSPASSVDVGLQHQRDDLDVSYANILRRNVKIWRENKYRLNTSDTLDGIMFLR